MRLSTGESVEERLLYLLVILGVFYPLRQPVEWVDHHCWPVQVLLWNLVVSVWCWEVSHSAGFFLVSRKSLFTTCGQSGSPSIQHLGMCTLSASCVGCGRSLIQLRSYAGGSGHDEE